MANARFRTIAADGREVALEDVDAVANAVRGGALGLESMVFDGRDGRWVRASEHDAIRAAVTALNGDGSSSAGAACDLAGHTTAACNASDNRKPHADRVARALKAFVGPNWESHYRHSFERQLQAEQRGNGAGWTWNWSAALFPTWFLYRRLHVAFFGIFGLTMAIGLTDKAFAQSMDGGSPFAVLFLGPVLLQGFLGDRLLFRRAMAAVNDPRLSDNPSRLAATGRPNWIGGWWPVILVGGTFVILILSALAGQS